MLSRIPAVKWAFNRLRPLPHGGSSDAAQIAADEQPTAIATEEAAPTVDTVTAEPLHREIEVVAESPPAAPADITVSEDAAAETPAEVEPIAEAEVSVSLVEVASEPVDAPELLDSDPPAELVPDIEPDVMDEAPVSSDEIEAVDAPELVGGSLPVEFLTDPEPEVAQAAPVSSVEVEAVDTAEPIISNDASPELLADVLPDVAEQVIVAAVETEIAPVETSGPVLDEEPVSAASVEAEPVAADETPVIAVATEVLARVVEASIDNEPAPSVAAEIEPVAPVAVDVAEDVTADAAVVAARVGPPPPPKSPAAPKTRAKPVEPADRAALVRQRWAETGIRMWNPRMHGTGETTLNIQGRIGLLPPEPGETMPRYDKLEFKLLGGQIVCEGVIVEAPAHASQRSFTRLAEPRGADRNREPVRERQAALA